MTFLQLQQRSNERLRLQKMNHPRIVFDDEGNIEIDCWCDGDDVEASRVILMTKKLRSLS